MHEPMDYEVLKERVDKELARQKRILRIVMLLVNMAIFVIFAVISFGIAAESGTSTPADSLFMLTIGWVMGIFFQAMSVFFDSGLADRSMRRQLVSRVVGDQIWEESERYSRLYAEKPKRDEADVAGGRMVLAEDGELSAIEDQDNDTSDSTASDQDAGTSYKQQRRN